MKYTSQHRCDKTKDDKSLMLRLFSKLYKIIAKKVTFVGFRRGRPPPWIRPCTTTHSYFTWPGPV